MIPYLQEFLERVNLCLLHDCFTPKWNEPTTQVVLYLPPLSVICVTPAAKILYCHCIKKHKEALFGSPTAAFYFIIWFEFVFQLTVRTKAAEESMICNINNVKTTQGYSFASAQINSEFSAVHDKVKQLRTRAETLWWFPMGARLSVCWRHQCVMMAAVCSWVWQLRFRQWAKSPSMTASLYGLYSSVKGRFDIFLLSLGPPPFNQSFAQRALTKRSSTAAGRILLHDLKPISLFE